MSFAIREREAYTQLATEIWNDHIPDITIGGVESPHNLVRLNTISSLANETFENNNANEDLTIISEKYWSLANSHSTAIDIEAHEICHTFILTDSSDAKEEIPISQRTKRNLCKYSEFFKTLFKLNSNAKSSLGQVDPAHFKLMLQMLEPDFQPLDKSKHWGLKNADGLIKFAHEIDMLDLPKVKELVVQWFPFTIFNSDFWTTDDEIHLAPIKMTNGLKKEIEWFQNNKTLEDLLSHYSLILFNYFIEITKDFMRFLRLYGSHINCMPHLPNRITDKKYRMIFGFCPNLDNLFIKGDDLKHISRIIKNIIERYKSLKILQIDSSKELINTDLLHLAPLKNNQLKLIFSTCPLITAEGIGKLGSTLKSLSLSDCDGIRSSSLEGFGQLNKLNELNLGCGIVTDQTDFTKLPASLRSLSVEEEINLTGKHLTQICTLSKLQKLELKKVYEFVDNDLEQLESLSKLQIFIIDGAKCTGTFLKKLPRSLKYLELLNCELLEAEYLLLNLSLFPELEDVKLGVTKITEEDIWLLRRRYPEVNFTSPKKI